MLIGELSRQSGVSVDTIRLYEQQGVLPRPSRRSSGFREYPSEMVEILRFCKRAQELGFRLSEIAELLQLSETRSGGHSETPNRVQTFVANIDENIRDHEDMIHDLEELRATLLELGADTRRRKLSGGSSLIVASLGWHQRATNLA